MSELEAQQSFKWDPKQAERTKKVLDRLFDLPSFRRNIDPCEVIGTVLDDIRRHDEVLGILDNATQDLTSTDVQGAIHQVLESGPFGTRGEEYDEQRRIVLQGLVSMKSYLNAEGRVLPIPLGSRLLFKKEIDEAKMYLEAASIYGQDDAVSSKNRQLVYEGLESLKTNALDLPKRSENAKNEPVPPLIISRRLFVKKMGVLAIASTVPVGLTLPFNPTVPYFTNKIINFFKARLNPAEYRAEKILKDQKFKTEHALTAEKRPSRTDKGYLINTPQIEEDEELFDLAGLDQEKFKKRSDVVSLIGNKSSTGMQIRGDYAGYFRVNGLLQYSDAARTDIRVNAYKDPDGKIFPRIIISRRRWWEEEQYLLGLDHINNPYSDIVQISHINPDYPVYYTGIEVKENLERSLLDPAVYTIEYTYYGKRKKGQQ